MPAERAGGLSVLRRRTPHVAFELTPIVEASDQYPRSARRGRLGARTIELKGNDGGRSSGGGGAT
eukprot:2467530-Prymnesium_polylepis.1